MSGPPAASGRAYGEAAREMISSNLAIYRRRFRDEAGLDATHLRAAGEAFRQSTAMHHPRLAAMLDGVAAGAGVPVFEVYALNARTELLFGNEPSREGCTAIGVLGTQTADGHLLLGQNWDWHPDHRDTMLLLRTTDERGHTVLTLTEAGMLAKAGVNSAGIGQCLTLLGSDRDGRAPGRPAGVPYHLLARATLEADCLAGAIRAACRSPRNASINLLLGQAGDPAHGDPAAGGELIDLELVPDDVGWLHPQGGMVTHANHLESSLPVHDRQKDDGDSSLFRAARARRLLAGAVAAGQVTTGNLAGVLRDHGGFPVGICQHLDERRPPSEHSATVYSILLDLDDRRLGLAEGPPCSHQYRWYDSRGPQASTRHPVPGTARVSPG